MPSPSARAKNPEEELRKLRAELKLKDKTIASLQKDRSHAKKNKLIPKPTGQSGRSSEKGGYNLQIEMGLEEDDAHYNRLGRMIKRNIQVHLSISKPFSEQEKGKVARLIALTQKEIPFLRKFEGGWPIRDIVRTYLSNEQTRRRRDIEAEQAACPDPDASRLSDDEDSVSVLKKTKTKKKHTVKFAQDDADDEEGWMTDGDGLTEFESDVTKVKATKVCSAPKPKPISQKVKRAVVSDEEDDEDEDEDTDLLALTNRLDKNPKTPTKLKNKLTAPTPPPTTKQPTAASKGKPPRVESPKKRNSSEVIEKESASAASKKRKLNSGLPADDASRSSPTDATPTSQKYAAKPLIWRKLPPHCPSALCCDPLPTELVPQILSLFTRRAELISKGGPKAGTTNIQKGLSLVEAEICLAIKQERRRDAVLLKGTSRGWLQNIDWSDVRSRIFDMREDVEDLVLSSKSLQDSPIWADFLLSINYELMDFCTSPASFPGAISTKHCGYYGPKGEIVISSTLALLVAETDENVDLTQHLLENVDRLIKHGRDKDKFDQYDYDVTSNLMSMKHFTEFILVPWAATSLILQDIPDLNGMLDATLERENSKEFGELCHPDDDENEEVAEILRLNTFAMRAVQNRKGPAELVKPEPKEPESIDSLNQDIDMADFYANDMLDGDEATVAVEDKHIDALSTANKVDHNLNLEADTAPPRHRKPSGPRPVARQESLKIRIPRPKVVAEQNVTLDDYPSPKPKKPQAKQEKKQALKTKPERPKPKPKTKTPAAPAYNTRSRRKPESDTES
ncbi:hypothetical protein B0H17DRAFT_1135391 [Mycena rosella]|uniref:Uncharacterized protein n=1 Tax=Mycena rosella TaxID=1033263 RepID=A0AAD7DDM9_MYCRO|nr:hypothetical protein B0H17DRAFT_1135391 [Mycena rosella]